MTTRVRVNATTHPSDDWVPFCKVADAYVESYYLVVDGNCTFTVWVMWCPDGRILVKPGCLDVEPIDATIRRLERIAKTDHWRRSEFQPERTKAWLKILRDCATYEWSAE